MIPRRAKLALAIVPLAVGLQLPAGCSSPLSGLRPIQTAGPVEYRIDAGDRLRITVPDLKDLSAEYVVEETGVVAIPVIKQVNLRGKTFREAELAIEDALRSQQILVDPKVSVQPLDLRPLYIMGEVNRPGEYPYRQGMTVFSAISVAGGYTYRARSGKVSITRTVNGKQVRAAAVEDVAVLPGDRIQVAERWF